MLNFKCMLKCLTEVLTHKTRSLQLFQTEEEKKSIYKPICTPVIFLGYYYYNKILVFKLHSALQYSASVLNKGKNRDLEMLIFA